MNVVEEGVRVVVGDEGDRRDGGVDGVREGKVDNGEVRGEV